MNISEAVEYTSLAPYKKVFLFYAKRYGKIPATIIYSPNGDVTDKTTTNWVVANSKPLIAKKELNFSNPDAKVIYDALNSIISGDDARVASGMQTLRDKSKAFTFKEVSSRDELFSIWINQLLLPIAVWTKHMGEAPDIAATAANKESSHISFPDSMTTKKRNEITKMLADVKSVLAKKGLGSLLNTAIGVADLGKRVGGTYNLKTKSLIINSTSKIDSNMVHYLLHELGHKYYFEVLDQKTKETIEAKFKSLDTKQETSAQSFAKEHIGIGDLIIPTKKMARIPGILVVGNISNNGAYCVKVDPKTFKPMIETPGIMIPFDMLFDGKSFSKIDDVNNRPIQLPNFVLSSQGDISKWFPTEYSASSPEEWFAECFVPYITGSLSGEPLAFFKSIIG